MIDEISGDFLQWLRGFYFVAKERGLRQASIAMGREKSTISRQIQCLENELGVTLFNRSSGKMVITPEGKILQEEADALFEGVKRIKGEFKQEGTSYRGKIFIATTHAIIDSILPPYIEDFRRLHPAVTFQFDGASPELVYQKVESGEMDFGITFFERGHKTLVYHDLHETGLVMIAPKNSPFFPGKVPTLQQMAEAPLILRGSHEPLLKGLFAKGRLKPNVVMVHNNFANLKKYVAHGVGVAIMGGHTISPEDEQNFAIFSLDRYFPKRKYGIILKKKKYFSAMVKAFIRTIKPDIDFSANREPSEAPVLSMPEILRKRVGLSRKEAPKVKTGRGKKR